jgi:hypothetical protein
MADMRNLISKHHGHFIYLSEFLEILFEAHVLAAGKIIFVNRGKIFPSVNQRSTNI